MLLTTEEDQKPSIQELMTLKLTPTQLVFLRRLMMFANRLDHPCRPSQNENECRFYSDTDLDDARNEMLDLVTSINKMFSNVNNRLNSYLETETRVSSWSITLHQDPLGKHVDLPSNGLTYRDGVTFSFKYSVSDIDWISECKEKLNEKI